MRKFVAMLSIGGCMVFAAAARGEEPADPQNRVEFEVKVHSPLLAQVPFLKQFFAQVGEHAPCPQKCEPKECEKLGVDFEFAGPHGPVVLFSHPFMAPPGVCQVCPPPAPCVVGAAKCSGECAGCAATCSKCSADSPCKVKLAACACDDCQCSKCQCDDCHCGHARSAKAERDELIEHILEVSTEKAALEAALEAHTAFAEERKELLAGFTELMTENAKLTARIEFQAERDQLNKQLVELAAQNAHLKAEVALTQVAAKLALEKTQLAIEKEKLEHRVAELERHFDQGINTAKLPQSSR